MPAWWFTISIKYIAPLSLATLFVINMYTLFAKNDGKFGYALWAEIIGGWAIAVLVFASGFIVKLITKSKRKNGFVEETIAWDDIKD